MYIKCHHFKLSQLIAVNSIHRSLGNSRFCVEGEWYSFPSKHGASPNVVSMSAHPMLAQRLRRWLNVETGLGECLVSAGNWHEWKLWLPRQSPEGEVMSVGVVTARGRRHGLWPGAGWSRSAKLDSLPGANVGLMLAQRRRRWSNIKPTLVQRVMFRASWHALLSAPSTPPPPRNPWKSVPLKHVFLSACVKSTFQFYPFEHGHVYSNEVFLSRTSKQTTIIFIWIYFRSAALYSDFHVQNYRKFSKSADSSMEKQKKWEKLHWTVYFRQYCCSR